MGAIIMFFVLGFVPGYIAAKILQAFNLLRIPREIELLGLDISAEIIAEQEAREVTEAERAAARELGVIP